jgi:hypothetical protein
MSEFVNSSNKGILWDFLNENKKFEGINNKYKINIQGEFDNTIKLIDTERKTYSLIDKNKEFIRVMIEKLNEYRQRSMQEQSALYTNKDIQQDRKKILEKEYERKKEEFNGIKQNAQLPTVNFSEKLDGPLSGDMDSLIMQTIKMREEQLNYAFDKKSITTATEWIANSSNSSNNSNNSNSSNSSGAIATSNNINLKIGNNTKLNNDQIITLDKKKEVSFNESYNDYIDNTTLDSNKIDVSNIGGVLEVLNNMDDNTSTSDKNNVNKFFNKFKTTYLDTDMNDNTYESNTNINENAAILNKVNKIYERQEELFKSIDYIKKLLNKEYEF